MFLLRARSLILGESHESKKDEMELRASKESRLRTLRLQVQVKKRYYSSNFLQFLEARRAKFILSKH